MRNLRWLAAIGLSVLVCGTSWAANYPVRQSGNGRYLVDLNNAPFLVVGDSPQSLVVNLSTSNASGYLRNRATNGFNTVLVDVLCTSYTGGPANGSLLDGTLPFANTIAGGYYDLTKPNSTYFAQVDLVVNMAATNGLLVVLDPIETGGWIGTMTANGSNSCYLYGQYLGDRYKSFPNVLWQSGNDYDAIAMSSATHDAVVLGVINGIKNKDTSHVHTVLNGAPQDSFSVANFWPVIDVNSAYTYYATYDNVLTAYARTNLVPVYLGEAHYELETQGYPADSVEATTAAMLRRQAYWTMLSGGCGQLYGNHYTWTFTTGWQSNLNTVGVTQLQYWANLFVPRSWWTLVPNTDHTLLTAGYGTYSANAQVSVNDYATAARTSDGMLVLAYLPTVRTVTVDMTKLSGTTTARWYDPSAGTYATVSGSPFANTGARSFTPPANNRVGDGDWVLVLEAAANALQIVTSSLPPATTGSAYSTQVTAVGGSPPYIWSLASSSPPAPPGLSFSTQGVLSGVATSNGAFTIVVQVRDSTNALATQSFTLLITSPDTTAPTVPTGLLASGVSANQISLSWVASTDNVGVTWYRVERSQGAGATSFAQVGTPTGTSYSDTGLAAATVYNYRVRATDGAGNLSGYSSVASATTTNALPATGLVAAYGFNEGTGTTVADASGNGNAGTISGATWTSSGKYGNALVFDGTSAKVTISDSASLRLTTAMTLEAWVNASTISSAWRDVIYKGDDNYYLMATSDHGGVPCGGARFGVSLSYGEVFGTTVLTANAWTHLAMTYDGATLRLYVNGVQIANQAKTGAIQTSTNPLQIGGDSLYVQYFKGTIDEVRVYNRALSAAEIQSDLNAAVGSTPNAAPMISGMAVQAITTGSGASAPEAAAVASLPGSGSVTVQSTSAITVTLASLVGDAKGHVVLRVEGLPGRQYLIETSEDLVSWMPLGVVHDASGVSSFNDSDAASHNQRFYRAVEAP